MGLNFKGLSGLPFVLANTRKSGTIRVRSMRWFADDLHGPQDREYVECSAATWVHETDFADLASGRSCFCSQFECTASLASGGV